MTQLVSVEEAREHLRIDTDADDFWLDMMITAVSAAVLAWLKEDWRAYLPIQDSNGEILEDSNGDTYPVLDELSNQVPKPQVKAAVLIELAQHYRFRDGSGVAAVPSNWGYGYSLGVGATCILAPLRKTTII